MIPLHIQATSTTPEVHIDPSTARISIEGSSYPSHPEAFFQPIIDHIQQWVDLGVNELNIVFALHYVNTSSSKYLLRLLQLLDKAYAPGKKFELHWHYLDYDSDIKEQGEMIFAKLHMPRFLVKSFEKDPQSSSPGE